jgi:hypothetical protein
LSAPFLPDDLAALEGFLDQAAAVVTMEDIYDGTRDAHVIGLRHDCDNEIHSSVQLAAWEAERGYRATYYVLHTAPYWREKMLLRTSLETIASHGHAIALHNDAITVALETGRDPIEVLTEVVEELRGYGHEIRSTVAHGSHVCHIARYVNDEVWDTCERSNYGSRDRVLEYQGRKVQLRQVPLRHLGLDFDANWLHRADYLSDSGGMWSQPFDEVAAAWPTRGQLHLLQHPCWWTEALERTKVAA